MLALGEMLLRYFPNSEIEILPQDVPVEPQSNKVEDSGWVLENRILLSSLFCGLRLNVNLDILEAYWLTLLCTSHTHVEKACSFFSFQ